jgi:hypothetical protein
VFLKGHSPFIMGEQQGEGADRWEGITFLVDLSNNIQSLSSAELALLRHVERRPSDAPLPGEGAKAWETPPPANLSARTSPVCVFGEATEILGSLQRGGGSSQLNPRVPAFEERPLGARTGLTQLEGPVARVNLNGTPENGPPPPATASKPLNAASAPFVPNIPLPVMSVAPPPLQPQHPQTIHINHMTTNVNYHVPHISAAAAAMRGEVSSSQGVSSSPAVMNGGINTSAGSIALSAMPLPFSVGGPYVHPFPPQQAHPQQLPPPPAHLYPADSRYHAPLLVIQPTADGYYQPIYHHPPTAFQPPAPSMHQPPPPAPPKQSSPTSHPVTYEHDNNVASGTFTFGTTPPFVSVKGKLEEESGSEDEDLKPPPSRLLNAGSTSGSVEAPVATEYHPEPRTAAFPQPDSRAYNGLMAAATNMYGGGPAAVNTLGPVSFPPPPLLHPVPPPTAQLPAANEAAAFQPPPFTHQQQRPVMPAEQSLAQHSNEVMPVKKTELMPSVEPPPPQPRPFASGQAQSSAQEERPTEVQMNTTNYMARQFQQNTLEYRTDAPAPSEADAYRTDAGAEQTKQQQQPQWLSPRAQQEPVEPVAVPVSHRSADEVANTGHQQPPPRQSQPPLSRKLSQTAAEEAVGSELLAAGGGGLVKSAQPAVSPVGRPLPPAAEPSPKARIEGQKASPVEQEIAQPSTGNRPQAALEPEKEKAAVAEKTCSVQASAAPVSSWANRLFSTPNNSSSNNKGIGNSTVTGTGTRVVT